MKRQASGIWHCGPCMETAAGGLRPTVPLCSQSQVSGHQNLAGLERPVEAPPSETLLAYIKWANLCNKVKFQKKKISFFL